MESTDISEGDVPKVLNEYQVVSEELHQHSEYADALEALRYSQELLETVSSQGGAIDPKFVICTLHNMAVCHQK